jgi:hypothetical protein
MTISTRTKQHEALQLAKIEAFILTLQRALERKLKREASDINFAYNSKAELNEQLVKVQNLLSDLALEDERERVAELFANELEFIKETFDVHNVPIKFDENDRQTVKALVTIEFDKINTEAAAYVSDMRTIVASNVLLGNVPDFEAIADEFGERFARNLKTELNTSTSMFNGEMSLNKAKDALGDDPFMVYIGPLDKKTREFCRKHVGKKYRLSEVEKMDNGQGLDVVTAKGGYNCRHVWAYVDDDYDENAA